MVIPSVFSQSITRRSERRLNATLDQCKVPVDVLINTSSSEGLPVSIMEAMSFGIPIIATNVGGTSELVTDKTGILIPKNCSPEDVSEAINRISKKSRSTDFRIEVRNAWKSKVNAQENFTNFAEQLNSISEQNTD